MGLSRACESFLREVTRSLAHNTGALAIATTEDGDLYCSGYANILEMPEFFDIDVTKQLLEALDSHDYIQRITSQPVESDEDVQILLGDDLSSILQGPYSLVYTTYQTPMQHRGAIGVIGPVRLNYTYIVPAIRNVRGLVREIAKGW